MNTPTFMLIPSLACQASCKYCFGPHKGAIMKETAVKESIRFIRQIAIETSAKDISMIFHGGEPLMMPIANWEILFDEVKSQLFDYKIDMNLQSNLWNLTDDLMKLFCANNVSIGTSLDGPKELCDLNRGEGYFEKTYASIKKANSFGRSVSGIATVTKQTMPFVQEIAKYYRNNGLSLVLHGALAGMDTDNPDYALSAAEYKKLATGLFPWYVKNRKHIKISTLDYFVKGFVTGNPSVCTHKDCFGMFLAISPTGDITSCQRLAGKKEFRLGNIFDRPSLAELYHSQAAQVALERERSVVARCSACDVYPICKGGCYYNAITSNDGIIDPLCEAYKEIYGFVRDNVMEEMLSDENMEAIANQPAVAGEHPLFRKGCYISLADKVHPTQIADNARAILALYELSKTNDPFTAAQNLFKQKICGDVGMTEQLLKDMHSNIHNKHKSLNNCYVHVTFDCNLRCTHCYVEAGNRTEEIRLDTFEKLIQEAIAVKFRQVIVTGGEPLVHSQRDALFKLCETYKGKGTNLVLRTNLYGDFSADDFRKLAHAFDQVVVSVDGNEQTHNDRRGKGTYQNTKTNLEHYARLAADIPKAAELSIACVMSAAEINGEPGWAVRQLGHQLNIRRIRFRPLLPIGRASQWDEPVMCEGLMQHVSANDMLKTRINPLTTCGIGQNLFITPNGNVYPCYAWCGEHTCIGNVTTSSLRACKVIRHGKPTYTGEASAEDLPSVLASSQFKRLVACTVDTIERCKDCAYRYLCGGACRAWGNRNTKDLNAPPVRCDHLQERAQRLIDVARNYLSA